MEPNHGSEYTRGLFILPKNTCPHQACAFFPRTLTRPFPSFDRLGAIMSTEALCELMHNLFSDFDEVREA